MRVADWIGIEDAQDGWREGGLVVPVRSYARRSWLVARRVCDFLRWAGRADDGEAWDDFSAISSLLKLEDEEYEADEHNDAAWKSFSTGEDSTDKR